MSYKLKKDTKIYVAGHKGLIGSAFVRFFEENNYTKLIVRNREDLELTSQSDTFDFFQKTQPEVVILAAGKVGGIIANRDFPADFITQNLSIQLNVFNAALKFNVKKLIFFGSSCMYPKVANQPMSEDQLFTGHPEPTSIAYATAKYAGVQMCQAINRQNNTVSFIPVIPNSAYGPNDNFDLNNSHVLSALIRRFHEAKEQNDPTITVWGSGNPKREFIHSDDIAGACLMLLNRDLLQEELPVNIGIGKDISIKDLAERVKFISGYAGDIIWDGAKPDGAPRKLLDNTRIKNMGWDSKLDFNSELEKTYQRYIDNKDDLKKNIC